MQKFWQNIRMVGPFLIILSLTGCSKDIVSDVTRFHNLPAPNAETIEVVSLDPALQNSLEFGQYAELVGRHLGSVGYRPAKNKPSDLIARITYGARPVDSLTDNGPRSSVGVGVGGGGHRTGVGVGLSFPIGNSTPEQEYILLFSLEITRRSDGVKLYEGRVSSRGKESLALTMPYLVDALFRDFPGKSGTSSRIKVSP
ncbi:MAG: hypothetical protein COA81_11855 [Alphaproteobacteria bacterium]|nr:MAG: hypothetical protein COA81_11855 [Alphaproteobacteria bacterium]